MRRRKRCDHKELSCIKNLFLRFYEIMKVHFFTIALFWSVIQYDRRISGQHFLWKYNVCIHFQFFNTDAICYILFFFNECIVLPIYKFHKVYVFWYWGFNVARYVSMTWGSVEAGCLINTGTVNWILFSSYFCWHKNIALFHK